MKTINSKKGKEYIPLNTLVENKNLSGPIKSKCCSVNGKYFTGRLESLKNQETMSRSQDSTSELTSSLHSIDHSLTEDLTNTNMEESVFANDVSKYMHESKLPFSHVEAEPGARWTNSLHKLKFRVRNMKASLSNNYDTMDKSSHDEWKTSIPKSLCVIASDSDWKTQFNEIRSVEISNDEWTHESPTVFYNEDESSKQWTTSIQKIRDELEFNTCETNRNGMPIMQQRNWNLRLAKFVDQQDIPEITKSIIADIEDES